MKLTPYFARVVNKPNPSVLSTKAAKPQMYQFPTFKFKNSPGFWFQDLIFSTILVSRLGKYSNGELLQVSNVQLRIFIDDIIVWQVACELLEKTLRYGLEHSIGNPHTEFGFVPMNTDEGV